MINRVITHSNQNSFFLFGARGTGKSTWLKQEFSAQNDYLYIDLLSSDEEEAFAKNPDLLKLRVAALPNPRQWVVIDEVQKIPKLLDVVHHCIENFGTRFVLTGSSARKLKRGHANMLAGRAFVHHLYPFTRMELQNAFSLDATLKWGALPHVVGLADDTDKTRYLRSYTQTYLKEEIALEQIVRKLEPFRLFLEVAAQHNGDIVNYANIGRDVGVNTLTAQSYFQILEDTLVGHLLPAYHHSIRKRIRQNPKFYFFDIGVARHLNGTLSQDVVPNTYGYGRLFEQMIVLEAIRLNSYFEKDFRLSYLRTKDGAEVDLIIERPGRKTAFVEIKSTERVDERDIRTLKAFARDLKDKIECFCLSRDPVEKNAEGIFLLPWDEGLRRIGFVGG